MHKRNCPVLYMDKVQIAWIFMGCLYPISSFCSWWLAKVLPWCNLNKNRLRVLKEKLIWAGGQARSGRKIGGQNSKELSLWIAGWLDLTNCFFCHWGQSQWNVTNTFYYVILIWWSFFFLHVNIIVYQTLTWCVSS